MCFYHVASGGKDTNPGTLAEPWLTIGYAIEHVPEGGIIYLHNWPCEEMNGSMEVIMAEKPTSEQMHEKADSMAFAYGGPEVVQKTLHEFADEVAELEGELREIKKHGCRPEGY